MSSELDFGKHVGKTLVEAMFADPAWFLWAIERGVFRDQGGPSLQREAEVLWFKARRIRIPKGSPAGAQVAYYYQGWNGKFMGAAITTEGRYEEHAILKNFLDIGHVCDAGKRDGVGNKRLVKDIKRILFGEKTRVTGDQLERFFANPDNFNLSDLGRQAAE